MGVVAVAAGRSRVLASRWAAAGEDLGMHPALIVFVLLGMAASAGLIGEEFRGVLIKVVGIWMLLEVYVRVAHGAVEGTVDSLVVSLNVDVPRTGFWLC